jgi:hypothetical protein
MYNQDELDLLAAQAKKELEAQKNGQTLGEDLYADIMKDVNSDNHVYRDVEPEKETVEQSSTPNYPNNQQQEYYDYQAEQQALMDAQDQEMYAKEAPNLAPFDETLFPGGPTKSQIAAWKKEWDGYDIFVTQILNQFFVFRTMNRFEYKQLVSFTDIDALMREETICQTVTLWPGDYNYKDMAVQKAGIPSTLSEIIMEKSGFTKNYAVEEL